MDRLEFFRKWGLYPMIRFNRTGLVTMPEHGHRDGAMMLDLARVDRIVRRSPRFKEDVWPNSSKLDGFEYDAGNILATRSWGRPIEKFSWNPVTGELLFVHPLQQHAFARGTADFDDYVRAIVLHGQRTVLFRPFWPTWMRHTPYHVFDEEAAAVSLDAQWCAMTMVEVHDGTGWDFEMNTNNTALAEMTGRRNW